MKRLIACFLALCTSIAFGATTVPVQLLNPTGSTSGQAIVSTGASSAPTWGSVSATALTGLVPTSNGGLGANNSAANGVPVFSSGAATVTATTGTGAPVLGTSPTIATPLISGVTSGAAAASGKVGEIISATGTAVSLTTGVTKDITSISLPAGDWDVWGSIDFNPAASTVTGQVAGGISTTSATLPGAPFNFIGYAASAANSPVGSPVPGTYINVTTSTPVYLIGYAIFSTSTMTATATIIARRRH